MKSQKTTPNIELKVAIVRSQRTARQVSVAARIGEVRLSKIVNGALATERERRALARVLDKSEGDLFPVAS